MPAPALPCPSCQALAAEAAEARCAAIALDRLHGSVARADVLEAIQDVVINIVGSEELCVFELGDDRTLRAVQAFGLDARRTAPVALGEGAIGGAAAHGRGWITGDGPPPPGEPDLTACLPLAAAGRVVGVLAVWRMLGHKPRLEEPDRRVLELLGRHAGNALYLTAPRAS